ARRADAALLRDGPLALVAARRETRPGAGHHPPAAGRIADSRPAPRPRDLDGGGAGGGGLLRHCHRLPRLVPPAARHRRARRAAEEALALQRWLHGGALLGTPGRVVVFLSGLAMPVLFVTGLAAWLLRRRNRRRARQPVAATLPGRTA